MDVKRALILGLGESGKSAARYLIKCGWEITGVDRLADIEENLRRLKALLPHCEVLGERQLERITTYLPTCTKVIISPGIDLTHPIAALAQSLKIPLQSELELGAEAIYCAKTARSMIAVTGSNGKTTVVSWLAHVLCNLGEQAISAGNIGTPLTSCIEGDNRRIVVVEISSFQLQAMQLPIFDSAALLNISQNHLDRHGDLFRYGQLKCKVQALLRDPARLFVSQCVDELFASSLKSPYNTFGARPADTISYRDNQVVVGPERALFDLPEGLFAHDIQNFCAVLGMGCQLGLKPALLCSAAQNFSKPSHRLEWICTFDGIDYYDDSKATSPDAVVKAVDSFNRPIILIAGGADKKVSFETWILAFCNKVRKIFAIGEAAPQMISQLAAHIPILKCTCLGDAFSKANASARAGDVILLSPGCSSFDMFENYRERGRCFAQLAEQLNHEDVTR